MKAYYKLINKLVMAIKLKRDRKFMISREQKFSVNKNKIYTMIVVKEVIRGPEHVRRMNLHGRELRKKWTDDDYIVESMFADFDDVKVLQYLISVFQGRDEFAVVTKDEAREKESIIKKT